MTEDPDFAAFWAIFPRKDREAEARFEWQRAVRQFGADPVILAAARYCARTHARPQDAVFTASMWLAGLTETECPSHPPTARDD